MKVIKALNIYTYLLVFIFISCNKINNKIIKNNNLINLDTISKTKYLDTIPLKESSFEKFSDSLLIKLESNEKLKNRISDSIYIIERFDDVSFEVVAIQITRDDNLKEYLLLSEYDGSEDTEEYEYTYYKIVNDSLYVIKTIKQFEGVNNDTIIQTLSINKKGIKEIDNETD